MQGAEGRRLPRHPGQLQPRHHHDRPGHRRCGVHRADQLADGGAHHRQGASGRSAADHGRSDRAELRAGSGRPRRAGEVRRRVDRRAARSDPHGRGPRTVQAGDDRDRAGKPQVGRGQELRACGGDPGPARVPGHHPAQFHAGRHRRRHCLQQGRVRDHRQAWPRHVAHPRGADRRIGAGLEGIRDGSGPRHRGQLHHHLRHREPRSDGRAYRRLDHRGAGTDAHRQGIPASARRLHRGAAQDRRGHRRFQRAIRHQPGRRSRGGDRDEPARVALLRAGVEGHRLPDRQGRGQAGGGLHAGRAEERHHRRAHAGLVRADDRLRGHQDSALRLREVPRGRCPPDHADEVGRRGDGDRAYLPRIPAEGLARTGDRQDRPQPHRPGHRHRRRAGGAQARTPRASSRSRVPSGRRVPRRAVAGGGVRSQSGRSLVPRRVRGHRAGRGGDHPAGHHGTRRAAPARTQAARLRRRTHRRVAGHRRSFGAPPAPHPGRAPGVQAGRFLRRRVRHQHRLHVLDLRGRVRGAAYRSRQDHRARRRPQPHRPGHRVRLLLRACLAGAARGRL